MMILNEHVVKERLQRIKRLETGRLARKSIYERKRGNSEKG